MIRGGGSQRAWNGILYQQGLSGKNVGATALSINVATVPPGAIAYAHIHDGFEVMLFIVQGKVKHTYGEGLSREVINEAGDFIYIKPGVPHEVFNIGDEPLIAFVARSAADEWDKIVNYPSQYRPQDALRGSTPSEEAVREFVIAGHGNLERVQQLLAEQPALLTMAYEWRSDDRETALQAAAHVGSRPVAEYLLANGAPLDICAAAMLGRTEAVEQFLHTDPDLIRAVGAHRIPLLTHAALSGRVELVSLLVQRGATEGMSSALSNAVSRGHVDLTRWLLENGHPDLTWKNFQGKTALDIATERGNHELVELLRGVAANESVV